MNPFLDAEAGVDGDASGDEGTDDKNDDLDGFNLADDDEFELLITCLSLLDILLSQFITILTIDHCI